MTFTVILIQNMYLIKFSNFDANIFQFSEYLVKVNMLPFVSEVSGKAQSLLCAFAQFYEIGFEIW